MAQTHAGTFLLRIEDIDQGRARAEWEDQLYDDLAWLGLTWPLPVMRQSERLDAYTATLDMLWAGGFLYPCTCKRRDIAQAVSAPQEGAPMFGPDGLRYPGTCRPDAPGAYASQPCPRDVALRLDTRMLAFDRLAFEETGAGPDGQSGQISFTWQAFDTYVGDIVLARRDMGTSYHLSVVLDDAEQAITHVTRGRDLFDATQIHVVLQHILGLPTPVYHHHRLIRDAAGKRLAKRDDARAIRAYRTEGASPQDIYDLVGFNPALAT